MRLALALGMTVSELLERVTSRELMEWEAFARLEPFGEERKDIRAGVIAATIAEVNRDKKKRKKPYKPEDFFPELRRDSVDGYSLLEKVRGFNAALGGEDRTK